MRRRSGHSRPALITLRSGKIDRRRGESPDELDISLARSNNKSHRQWSSSDCAAESSGYGNWQTRIECVGDLLGELVLFAGRPLEAPEGNARSAEQAPIAAEAEHNRQLRAWRPSDRSCAEAIVQSVMKLTQSIGVGGRTGRGEAPHGYASRDHGASPSPNNSI
jgi:hypothetical protein